MSNIPDWISFDFKIIKRNQSTLNETLVSEGNEVHLDFDMHFKRYAQANEQIINPERIRLVYQNKPKRHAPVVNALRSDFPRDLPHLNPVPEQHLVSICLWRKGGTDSLYIQRGILELLKVLKSWLEEASVGQLNKDGWEPSPRSSIGLSVVTDIAWLQKQATKTRLSNKVLMFNAIASYEKSLGNLWGVAYCCDKNIKQVDLKNTSKKKASLMVSQELEKNNDGYFELRCIVPIPENNHVDDKNSSAEVGTLEELKNFGNYQALSQTIDEIEKDFQDKKDRHCLVLVIKRRPLPLIQDIMGLSEDNDERKIEIIPFYIRKEKSNVLVQFVSPKSDITSKELSDISGIENTNDKVGIIGCGSLGSSIADQLARAGVHQISIWDDDVLEPHNSARHISIYQKFNILPFKSILLEKHIKEISLEHSKNTSQKTEKLLTNNQIPEDIEHIIDSTASNLPHLWHSNDLPHSLSKVYISDEGRIGIFQHITKNNNIDLLDLEGLTYAKATIFPELAEWFKRQSSLETRLVGLNCSSNTLTLSWSKILSHSSTISTAFFESITKNKSFIGLNFLDDKGLPKGYKVLAEESELEFERREIIDNNNCEWILSISDSAKETMRKVRQKHLPKEVGGYLLGLVCIETHRISITSATEGKLIHSNTASLKLAPICKDTEASSLLSCSNSMLIPLGTWHSHPCQSAEASATDLGTLNKALNLEVYPFVMVIVADETLNYKIGFKPDT